MRCWEDSDAAASHRDLGVRTPDCCSVLVEPIDRDLADELAQAFAALADPVRLRLFSMIASAGTACSCDLVEPIGKSQPTVSHHTKVLADAGLITGREGRPLGQLVRRARGARPPPGSAHPVAPDLWEMRTFTPWTVEHLTRRAVQGRVGRGWAR